MPDLGSDTAVDLGHFMLKGLVASTRAVPGRDIRFSRQALESAVRQDLSGMALHRNHGPQQVGRLTRVWLEETNDGEVELWCEVEAWVPRGEDVAGYLGTGFSFSVIERDEGCAAAEDIVIAADSLSFDDQALSELRASLAEFPPRVYVTRYHQFAELPPPAIVVDFAQFSLPILQGIIASGAWSLLVASVRRLTRRSTRPMDKLFLHVRLKGHVDIKAEVPLGETNANDVLEGIFEGVATVLTSIREDAS